MRSVLCLFNQKFQSCFACKMALVVESENQPSKRPPTLVFLAGNLIGYDGRTKHRRGQFLRSTHSMEEYPDRIRLASFCRRMTGLQRCSHVYNSRISCLICRGGIQPHCTALTRLLNTSNPRPQHEASKISLTSPPPHLLQLFHEFHLPAHSNAT